MTKKVGNDTLTIGISRKIMANQDVKDLATMRVGDRIENVDRGG